MTALVLDRLEVRRGGHVVAEDVSLSLRRDELVAVLGPSGGGKTSLLMAIAGLLRPSSGDLRWQGRSLLDVPAEARRFAMVFQGARLFPFLSVADNVGFGLRMMNVGPAEIRRAVGELLDRVGLAGLEERTPDQLSGGEQARAALARALIVRPRVLLLDEPLAHLDPHLRNDMRDLIVGMHREYGVATILVTHDQNEAVAMSDRIALMLDGRLVQTGIPEDFYQRPSSARVAAFFGATNFIPATKSGSFATTDVGRLRVAGPDDLDGKVLLTIRPEFVRILDSNAENTAPAVVEGVRFLGDRVAVDLGVNGLRLVGTMPLDAAERVSVGASVPVTLPAQRLWAVRASRLR